ncbi:MAG: hypothetical protein IJM59_06550 [Proteobacteria bacterium]|nr:hypothetical protein [Pseudomonadota bacterium]
MKNKWMLLVGIFTCVGLTACDEDESTQTNDPRTSFADLCEASGGTYKDEHTCVCSDEECSTDDVCNYVTHKCPAKTQPPECPTSPASELSFADACAKTGGTPNGNFCSCNGYQCKEFQTCAEDKSCPVIPIPPTGDLKFEVACQKTGGTPEDGSFCVCNGKRQNEYSTCVSLNEMTFAEACTNTGGTPDGHYCICDGEKQKEYETCTSPQPPDCDKCCESCGNCGGETCNFDEACKASGGTPAEGICVCGGKPCSDGVICNFNSGDEKPVCADNIVPQMCSTIAKNAECSPDNQNCISVCKDEKSVGKHLVCDGSKYVETVCKNDKNEEVSCKDDHSCGTCKNYTQLCKNNASGIGEIRLCQYGDYGDKISDCGDVSCRTDVPACGECKNDELKCTEDNDNNAIMYRCVDGRWKRIENKLDPYDPGYACPAACTEGTDPQKMEYECDRSQCDKCDPCWGEPMVGAPSNPNPCYDENRCKEVRKAEDKDYPPFRGFDWAKNVKDTRVLKEVTGYDFTDYTSQTTDERTHPFDIDLTNGKRRVSCNADGTYYGQCHNSLQLCVNEEYHKKGFIIQCAKGELSDYDGNGDGIACKCERLENNAEGCCYTRNSCFKFTSATSGTELCEKPKKDDDKGNYGY